MFEGRLEGAKLPLRYHYEIDYGDGATVTAKDPYRFLPTVGELDLHLVGEGRHEELWERLGAHVRELDGVPGTAFAVWAPAGRAVSVVGNFNFWDGRTAPDALLGDSSGIWELFIPESKRAPGTSMRSSPPTAGSVAGRPENAHQTEMPPSTASVFHPPRHFPADGRLARLPATPAVT